MNQLVDEIICGMEIALSGRNAEQMNMKALASVRPVCSASLRGMKAGGGRKASSTKALRLIPVCKSRMLSKHQTQNSCKKRNASSRWTTADSTRDKELDLDSPEACHLANEVLTLRNRAGALDYLYRFCQFKGRQNAQPALILPDLEITKVDRLEVPRQIEAGAALKTTPA